MGPLSAKQEREWAKHHAKEARESAKMESEESRKQQLHEIKLQEAAAKANQGIGHKEEAHSLKMKELGGPLSGSKRINRQKLGLPSNNPLAGTEVFNRGQHMLPKGTDTVPAMLTPGEAVIPRAAAQDPKNKPLIKKMVEEGRAQHYAKGTTGVVQRENMLPIIPKVMPKRNPKGYEDGTTSVNDHYAIGSESVPNVTANYYHSDSAATMSDGTTNVRYLEVGDADVAPYGFRYQNNDPMVAPIDYSMPMPKGNGYMGNVGSVETPVTEYTVDDNKGQYPSVVPTLSRDEVATVANEGMTPEIASKAALYRDTRESNGQSPFADRIGLKAPVGAADNLYKQGQPPPVSINELSAQPKTNYGSIYNIPKEQRVERENQQAAYDASRAVAKGYLPAPASPVVPVEPAKPVTVVPVAQDLQALAQKADAAKAAVAALPKPPGLALRAKDPAEYDRQIALRNEATKASQLAESAYMDAASKTDIGKPALGKPVPVSITTQQMTSGKPLPSPTLFSKPSAEDKWAATQESNNNPNAKNPLSSASGLYQMTDDAWKESIKFNPSLANIDKSSVAGQQAGRDAYKQVLANQLRAKGITPTEEVIRKAWVTGAGGYAAIAKGDPNAPLSLSDEAIKINPNLQGKTNAEFLSDPNPYSRKGAVPKPLDFNAWAKGKTVDTSNLPPEIQKRDTDFAVATQEKQDILDMFEKDAPVITSNNKKDVESWWSKVFEKVYGDTGLLNDRELVRAAILFGGSKALGYNNVQSARYAGRSTIAASDARLAKQEASQAESAKNLRELAESRRKDVNSRLADTNIPKTVRAGIEAQLPEINKLPISQQAAAYDVALRKLGINAEKPEKVTQDKDTNTGLGYIGNKAYNFYEDKAHNRYIEVTQEGKKQWVPVPAGKTLLTDNEYRSRRDDLGKSIGNTISKDVRSFVTKSNSKATEGEINDHVAAATETFKDMRTELGDGITDTDFKRMVENTINHVRETGGDRQFSQEGLRQSLYGNAVVKLREEVKDKYYNASDSAKKYQAPSAEALSRHGSVLQESIGSYQKAHPDQHITVDVVATRAESLWDSQPKSIKNEYTQKANATSYKTSPMMLWVASGGFTNAAKKAGDI